MAQPAGNITAPKPQRILDGKVELTYVSYSQIDVYKTCPLKYKYQYILQVPSRPHHAFSFGTTIHSVLQRFHQFQIKGMTPSLETLLHMYEQLFVDFGYESRQQRDLRFESGKKALAKYYELYTKQFEGKPKNLEVKFKIMISDIP
jgi:DNA helicase II / ATP-dependent DNA helicase PcrA